MFSRVVLPAPLGPRMTQRSPSLTDQETWSTRARPSRTTDTSTSSSTSLMSALSPIAVSASSRAPVGAAPRENLRHRSVGPLLGPVLRLGACSRNHAQDGWPHGEMPFWPDLSRRTTPRSPSSARTRCTGSRGCPGEAAPVGLTLALGRLRALGATGLRVALPVPGHPLGLSGPPEFNARALEAEEAVVATGAGARAGARGVRGRARGRCACGGGVALPAGAGGAARRCALAGRGRAGAGGGAAGRDRGAVAAGRGRLGAGGARRRWTRTGRGRSGAGRCWRPGIRRGRCGCWSWRSGWALLVSRGRTRTGTAGR